MRPPALPQRPPLWRSRWPWWLFAVLAAEAILLGVVWAVDAPSSSPWRVGALLLGVAWTVTVVASVGTATVLFWEWRLRRAAGAAGRVTDSGSSHGDAG